MTSSTTSRITCGVAFIAAEPQARIIMLSENTEDAIVAIRAFLFGKFRRSALSRLPLKIDG